jgi:hypothetical protein
VTTFEMEATWLTTSSSAARRNAGRAEIAVRRGARPSGNGDRRGRGAGGWLPFKSDGLASGYETLAGW